MFNPALPRGAFARVFVIGAFILAGLFALRNGAYAAEHCVMVDFDHLQADMADGKAAWLTDGQLQFARALHAAMPPVDEHFPYGDKAARLIGKGENGFDRVLFIDGTTTCHYLDLGGPFLKLLDDVKSGAVTHAPLPGDPI